MTSEPYPVHGAGLGLRRSFLGALAERPPAAVDFYEIAPENWIGMGGVNARRLRALTERHPFVCHGLSLSIGAPTPLDLHFVRQVKAFLDDHGIRTYSEHLSFCSDDGHLYDLLLGSNRSNRPIRRNRRGARPMSEPADVIRRQLAFAAHLRDPTQVARPEDVEDRGMAIYGYLVFNIAFGAGLMEDLRAKGVLLGTAR